MRALAALIFFTSIALGQECSADGTVVNSATGAPIVRASVTINHSTVMTDALGQWSLDHLPCGSVKITASRPTFLADPAQPAVDLVAGTPLHDVKIRLAPQAVVTGRVVDEQGDPIQGVGVVARMSRVVNGRRNFQTAMAGVPTNDIGEYRIAGLPAGKYIFCAMANSNNRQSSPRMFEQQCNPGPPEAGASAIAIRAGDARLIDFQLRTVSPRHVRGIVSGVPEGLSCQLTLVGAPTLGAPVLPDGTFDIENVAPGQYFLTAAVFQGNARFTGTAPVNVDSADVEGIQLHLEAGVDVTGTVKVVSTTGNKPEDLGYSVSLPGATGTEWNEDRTRFTFAGVLPGSYQLRFTAPAPFYVKSATLRGHDIAGSEVFIGPDPGTIEVVLSDDVGTLDGDVDGDSGLASGIVLQREGIEQERFARADPKGHFKFEALPPGDYKVSAWDDITNVEYADPEWMRKYAKSVAVTIQPGQTATAKLTRQAAPND